MKKIGLPSLGLGLAVLLSSASAHADFGDSIPPTTDWTGFYAGVNLGVIFNASRLQATNTNFIRPGYRENIDYDSVLPGLQLGYNYQTQKGWVFGVEGDFTYPDANGQFSYGSRRQAGVFDRFTAKNILQGSLRGRVGKALGDFFPYVTGGLSVADTGLTYGNELGQSYSQYSTQVGFIVGGGLEYSVMEHLSVRAEYLYANYGSAQNLNTRAVSCITDPNGQAGADLNSSTLRAALNYRF